MTPSAAIDVATVPAIDHVEGVRLGEVAYDRLISMFEGLAPEDWAKATDCAGWTVRHLAGHMVGAMRAAAHSWVGASEGEVPGRSGHDLRQVEPRLPRRRDPHP